MEEFKIVFTKTAEKDLNALDVNTRYKIFQAAKVLKTAPFPRGNIIKKLKGIKISLYRLRVGASGLFIIWTLEKMQSSLS